MLNSTNQVISAQDYDAWGYPLENRTYNSTAMRYDFTGKERDDQTSYDYFGARYYDSRIGRWGGVEPLLDKYPGLTSYCYSLNNPIAFFDGNGLDVYIFGNDASAVTNFMQYETPNLNLSIDKNTGKLSIEKVGNNLSKAEETIFEASTNSDINVNLNTTDKNYYEKGNENYYFAVGSFEGSSVNSEGVIETEQYFNLSHAILYAISDPSGGSSVGHSALHEIIESYIGNKDIKPGFEKPNKNDIYKEIVFLGAHRKTEEILPSSESAPSIVWKKKGISISSYIIDKRGSGIKIY